MKVIHQYALLGNWDFLNILEAPDELTMARVATTLAARGTLKTLTLTAIEVEDFIAALGDGVGLSRPGRLVPPRPALALGADVVGVELDGEQLLVREPPQPVTVVGHLGDLEPARPPGVETPAHFDFGPQIEVVLHQLYWRIQVHPTNRINGSTTISVRRLLATKHSRWATSTRWATRS